MTSATYGAAPKTNDSVTVNRPSKGHAIFHAIMVFVVMIVLLGIPFWLLVVTAGKTQAEAVVPNMSLPSQWHLLENFKTVLVDGKMIAAFFGSIVVTVPSVFLALLFGSMASWILARRTTKLLAVVYALGISGLILPPAVVTVMMLLKIIGLVRHRSGYGRRICGHLHVDGNFLRHWFHPYHSGVARGSGACG